MCSCFIFIDTETDKMSKRPRLDDSENDDEEEDDKNLDDDNRGIIYVRFCQTPHICSTKSDRVYLAICKW